MSDMPANAPSRVTRNVALAARATAGVTAGGVAVAGGVALAGVFVVFGLIFLLSTLRFQ